MSFTELPKHWEVKKLGDVCRILDGKRKPINSDERTKRIVGKAQNELFPYYGATGQVGYIDDFLLDGEYVLLGEDGAPFLEPFKPKAYLVKGRIWVNNHAHILQSFHSNEFLCYYLNQIPYREFVTGTTRLKLNQSSMKDIPCVVPPLAEQQRIVAKLEELFSELDAGLASLKTAAQQLKTYRQAVLKWAFEGKLTNDHVTDGELPAGWKWVKLGEVAENLDNLRRPINKIERQKRTGNIPYYGANGRTGWINDYLFDEPLILVVEDETFTGRELPFSYKITGKSWVNNHAHILRARQGLNLDYLNYQLFFYPFLPLTTGTTGRKKLTKLALMNARIKVCPLEEQHRIVQEIESRLSVCDKLEETIAASLRQAEALRQSILKQAFAGKLV